MRFVPETMPTEMEKSLIELHLNKQLEKPRKSLARMRTLVRGKKWQMENVASACREASSSNLEKRVGKYCKSNVGKCECA